MKEDILEEYVKQYYAAQPGPDVEFGWQGGEPLLMGLDFFKKIVELQQKHLPVGWKFTNTLQTNGTLLTPEWCNFLRENNFLVGISIDGPRELHDCYRFTKGQNPSFDKVMNGLRLLQEHKVEYNILCVVNNVNGEKPLDVYHFFKETGANYIQFIPIVERLEGGKVTDRTVPPEVYGQFLSAIFDEWIFNDIGKIFVQIIEECFRVWLGYPASLCIFRELCGDAFVLEHNGDLYSCDHFVFKEYNLGNIMDTPLGELIELPFQKKFQSDKKDTLTQYCLNCDVRFICNGGCLKNRFAFTPDGEPGLNFLCAGYKQFFHHIDLYMKKLVELWRKDLSPEAMMSAIRREEQKKWENVGRNDPCPCGSGKKFKKCCEPTFFRKESRQRNSLD